MKGILFFMSAFMMTITAIAQTLNIQVGSVIYRFPASQTGDMIFTDDTLLTVMGKTFSVSEIKNITVDETSVTDGTISVMYDGASASVVVAGNIARFVSPMVSGAHVNITQEDDLTEEITYTLSGVSNDGEFYMSGNYKATIELNGLTLTNTTPISSGAAIHIQNGKRIKVKVIDGTTNTLTDAGSGSQKGCLYIKGHAEFAQSGELNIVGNVKHAIKAGEYITIKNSTINVLSALGDGISCNEYFLINSGNVTINGTGDDGIQCDLDGTVSTGVTTDHEDEDSGNIYVNGGSITINCSAIAAKGLKAAGDIICVDGTVNIVVTGKGKWDSDDSEAKAACTVSADGNVNIKGGTLVLKATGSGGKGMKCDGVFTIDDGEITVVTSGGLYYNNGKTENTNYTSNTDNLNSNYYSSPKGIKAGVKTTSGGKTTYSGGFVVNGGTVDITTGGYNAEGIESKNTMYITNGTITVNSYDDGINSAREMYLQGGDITVTAKNNDAIDSNANLYISGGTIVACGASSPEGGLDAAEGCYLYITGGNVLAIGGSNNNVTSTTGSQCVLSTSGSVTAGNSISVKSGSSILATFTVPSTYSSSYSGGGGMGGRPSGSGNILISCDGLTSGNSYTVILGSSSINVTARTTSSGNMGGGR